MPSHTRATWSVRSLVRLLILGLVGLLAISVVIAVVGRQRVAANIDHVRDHLLPGINAVTNLGRAFADQDLARRGYLLAADEDVRQRLTEAASAEQVARRSAGRLLHDAQSRTELDRVDAAAAHWRAAVPSSVLASRAHAPLPAGEIDALTVASDAAYAALRVEIRVLRDHVFALVHSEFAQVADEQRLASLLVGVVIVLALIVAIVAALVMRRRVTKPAQRLLDDVAAVASGDYDRAVPARGARELREIADAVETMRNSVLGYAGELAGARASHAQQVEQHRLSAELHDSTLRRVFGLGLTLQSTALRHPEMRAEIEPLVDVTDEIIRELRRIIFDLRPEGSASFVSADA